MYCSVNGFVSLWVDDEQTCNNQSQTELLRALRGSAGQPMVTRCSSPWRHPPPLLFLKKETNIHPAEEEGDGRRSEEGGKGRRPRKGRLKPSKSAWLRGRALLERRRGGKKRKELQIITSTFSDKDDRFSCPLARNPSIFSRWSSWIIAYGLLLFFFSSWSGFTLKWERLILR